MPSDTYEAIGGFLDLIRHHRGEAASAYDNVGAGYDIFAQVWDSVIASAALAHFHRLVEQYTPPTATVLDAGAGTGRRTETLLAMHNIQHLFALDASREMLHVARQKVSASTLQFMQGDINRLPFPDNSFDVVTAAWVIEIMADPTETVAELLRVIKPSGTVIYVFLSLPEGPLKNIVQNLFNSVQAPTSHFLDQAEQPFHNCPRSSLKRFAGGWITVASVAKCCPIGSH